MEQVIAIIRTSTIQQEIDAQKKEIIDYIKKDGWSEEQIIICMAHGASAIKLDEEYKQNMDFVKSLISTKEIECVYAWSLDRIGRDEVFMIQFKNFLIDNKVNLKIKEPSLILLNSDGSVNSGMEIAIGLYITMAKQEMLQKKARFSRAKKRDAELGMYSGGNSFKFGYTIDENKYVVINQREADIIRLIFNLYNSREYSMEKLAMELNKRGITYVKGKSFNHHRINRIINDTSYIGFSDREFYNGTKARRIYPAIIDEETFNKAKDVRKSNEGYFCSRETRHTHYAVKILKCKECGTNFSHNNGLYLCNHRRFNQRYDEKCNERITINTKIMDGLLWDLAVALHTEYLEKTDSVQIEKLENEMSVLVAKLHTAKSKLSSVEKSKERILDLYVNGDITKEQKEKRIGKVEKDFIYYTEEIKRYTDEIEKTEKMISDVKNPSTNRLFAILDDVQSVEDEKKCKEIIMQHIEVAYIERIEFKKRRCVQIFIKDKKDLWHRYIYDTTATRHNQPYLYIWNGCSWIEYYSTNVETIQEAVKNINYKIGESYRRITQKEIDNIREETNWLHLDATTINKYERDLVQGYHNFIEYIDSPKVRTKLEAEITRKEIQKLLRGEIEMDDSLEIQLLQAKLDEKSYRRNKIEFVD